MCETNHLFVKKLVLKAIFWLRIVLSPGEETINSKSGLDSIAHMTDVIDLLRRLHNDKLCSPARRGLYLSSFDLICSLNLRGRQQTSDEWAPVRKEEQPAALHFAPKFCLLWQKEERPWRSRWHTEALPCLSQRIKHLFVPLEQCDMYTGTGNVSPCSGFLGFICFEQPEEQLNSHFTLKSIRLIGTVR